MIQTGLDHTWYSIGLVFPTELIDGTLFDSFGISCRFFISKDSSVLTAFLRRSQKLNQKAAFSKNVHMSAVAGAV